jgi:hypothetical protein
MYTLVRNLTPAIAAWEVAPPLAASLVIAATGRLTS